MITYTFLLLIIVFSVYCFNNRETMNKFFFHPYSIYHNKEHYRFLTHAFIHGDTMHLLFNCVALFSFGLAIEEDFFPYFFGPQLGKIYYIILFYSFIFFCSSIKLKMRKSYRFFNLSFSTMFSSTL